jgi:hypothetical protein
MPNFAVYLHAQTVLTGKPAEQITFAASSPATTPTATIAAGILTAGQTTPSGNSPATSST